MSTFPALVVRDDDPVPPYEQLRRQLSDMICFGVLAPGHRLPPLRQLAGDLGLALGTVARTYRELEASGLIASHRGAGTRVANSRNQFTPEQMLDALARDTDDYVRRALMIGASPEQISDAINRSLRP